MSRWGSNTTWLRLKGAKTAQKGAKRARHVALGPAMSRWPSNATWLQPKGTKSPKKRVKRVRHVVLGARHVALDLQHDVAPPPRWQNSPNVSRKSAPRRIGPPPCRVGPPTRRGSASKAPKQPKREQEERATSYWPSAMSCWTSNATWLPNFRLHRTVTGTDKRWRNHFGSKRGGLCVAVGSI